MLWIILLLVVVALAFCFAPIWSLEWQSSGSGDWIAIDKYEFIWSVMVNRRGLSHSASPYRVKLSFLP